MIISYHDAFFFKEAGYSSVQNTERLTEALSKLVEAYKDASCYFNRGDIKSEQYNQMVKNRAEFTAYFLIVTAGNLDGPQLLVSSTQQRQKQLEHPKERALVNEALKIRLKIESSDTAGFFKLFQSKKTNYLFSCLMLNFYHKKLEQLISQVKRATCVAASHRFQTDLLSRKLGLSEDDVKDLIEAVGYDFDEPVQ